MAFLTALDWPIRIVLGVVVAGTLGAGVVLAVRTSGGDDAQVAGQLTGTPPTLAPSTTSGPPTPGLTGTAAMATTTQPAPTQPPATEPQPTEDTRVAIQDLPSAAEIQLGKDGKYFIADRGDGCTWVEGFRRESATVGLVVSLYADCPAGFFFDFRPDTGEVFFVQE
ncbi:MAG: hypothetical protein WD939_06165, partial [Dehalococcoidia bacterium]